MLFALLTEPKRKRWEGEMESVRNVLKLPR